MLYFKACRYTYCAWKDDIKCVPIFHFSPSIPSPSPPECVCVCVSVLVCEVVTRSLLGPHATYSSLPKRGSHTCSVHKAVPKECAVCIMVLQMPVYTCDNITYSLSHMDVKWETKIALFDLKKKRNLKSRKKRSMSIRKKY